jgi:pimeloyl-ACP methyl ester carboxylesterase
MELTISGAPAYAYTGGRPFDPRQPAVILIHGAGHDHSVWNFQARSLAHHGFSVLVPDLPGHGRSSGAALASIEELADWVIALLDAAEIPVAALVGHSMGSLIALQAASQSPERFTRLALVGSVAPMPVADPLLDAARNKRAAAHGMINQWSYSPASQIGASAIPGVWLPGLNFRVMERQRDGVLGVDMANCNAYLKGLDAAAQVTCPTTLLCGERDQMTPLKAVKPLQEALANVAGGARIMLISGAGHAMMAEAPNAVSDSLRGFLTGK